MKYAIIGSHNGRGGRELGSHRPDVGRLVPMLVQFGRFVVPDLSPFQYQGCLLIGIGKGGAAFEVSSFVLFNGFRQSQIPEPRFFFFFFFTNIRRKTLPGGRGVAGTTGIIKHPVSIL